MRYTFKETKRSNPETYAIYDGEHIVANMVVGYGKIDLYMGDSKVFALSIEGELDKGFENELQRFNFMQSIDDFIYRKLSRKGN